MQETRQVALCIVGRPSSLFTRVPLLFAHTLGVTHDFEHIPDMTRTDPAAYADNPALKLPILRIGHDTVFGAYNICRVIAQQADAGDAVTWPENIPGILAANAHELLAHCMGAQVQVVMGTQVAALPADNAYFTKALAGMRGALHWLDAHLDEVLALFPVHRRLSWFEACLFCLLEHLTFRQTLDWQPMSALVAFARDYARRADAGATAYHYPQSM